MRSTFLVGDILLITGVVSVAAGAYLWWTSRPAAPKAAFVRPISW
jgi:hypothetical protein